MKRVVAFLLLAISTSGATVSVTDFGASGDAVWFTCDSTGSGATVTSTNLFSAADIGKAAILFHGGATTGGTNHQDFISTVASVTDQTNLTFNASPGLTANGVSGIIGTENCPSFRACIASLAGANDTVTIPGGTYLIISPFMLTNGTSVLDSAALPISRGGITFQGVSSPTLLSCGAWQLHGGAAYRGSLIELLSPVSNNNPLIFDGITFDGGVSSGYTTNHAYPASTTTGEGWDITHHAVWQYGTAPVFATTTFKDCTFQHWRGEMLISGVDTTDGWLYLTNCTFSDGNASGYNSPFSHRISNCTFDQLYMAEEFYQGYSTQPSFFENCLATNVDNGLVIVGALTTHTEQLYTIQNNQIGGAKSLFLNPARNLLVTGNTFFTGNIYASGAGTQGDDCCCDYMISGNTFTNTGLPALYVGSGPAVSNVLFTGNTVYDRQFLASGFGEAHAVTLSHNTQINSQFGPDSRTLTGQWFYDDGSNTSPIFKTKDLTYRTNVVAYDRGFNQEAECTYANSLFILSDANPSLTPAGAVISLFFPPANQPCIVQLSDTSAAPTRRIMRPNQTVLYRWSGSSWVDTTLSYAIQAKVGIIRLP